MLSCGKGGILLVQEMNWSFGDGPFGDALGSPPQARSLCNVRHAASLNPILNILWLDEPDARLKAPGFQIASV